MVEEVATRNVHTTRSIRNEGLSAQPAPQISADMSMLVMYQFPKTFRFTHTSTVSSNKYIHCCQIIAHSFSHQKLSS